MFPQPLFLQYFSQFFKNLFQFLFRAVLGDILSTVPDDYYYQPHYINEMNTIENLRLEKILGRKISNEAFVTYCTREDYEREQGISM